MSIQPYAYLDITPRRGGILTLLSYSIDGTYEVYDHLCKQADHSLLFRGNYTDIPLMIGPSKCIRLVNHLNYPIHVVYRWKFHNSTNALLISTIIMYVGLLLVIGVVFLYACSMGGRYIRRRLPE